VVLRYRNGSVSKGTTGDFFPNKNEFHVTDHDNKVIRVMMEELKAVFFVKDYIGNKKRRDVYEDQMPGAGRKVQVTFYDDERIIGFCQVYSSDRQGFFLVPADRSGNNERMYVITSAAKDVKFL
jgi:hypothetical protein